MKYSGALVLLAAACASPPRDENSVASLRVEISEPNAFAVSGTSQPSETRRYRINPGDLVGDDTDASILLDGEGGTGHPLADAAANVAESIRTFVAPGTWDSGARTAIYVDGDDLVIRHAPEVLGAAERFIETLKKSKSMLVRLKVRFIDLTPERLASLPPLPAVEGGVGAVIEAASIDESSLVKFVRPVTAPKLTLFHGQQGRIGLSSEFAYIAGYERVGAEYKPKPKVEWAGFMLEARAVANGPGSDRWILDLSVTVRDLPEVPRASGVILSGHLHEMPVVTHRRIQGRFVVGSGQAVLLLAPHVKSLDGIADPDAAKSRFTLILVELQRVE